MDILQNTNFFRAFTASASVPAIYIQQFWNTLTYEAKTGAYSFQLDETRFVLDANLLREALEITPIDQAHQFVSPLSGDAIMNFVNELGYTETSGHDRPRYPVLQMLWGIITSMNIDYAELMWEESVQAIQTFLTNKANIGSPTKKDRKDKPHVIPYCRLGNLKFVSKGEEDEVFGMPIPNELISNNIRNAPYYNSYLEMVAKHDRKIAAENEGKKKTATVMGKVQKLRKGKPSFQLIDEDEPTQPEPEPEPKHQGEGDEYDVKRAI
ncbi:hypothetical protein Tco_0787936 [Tanacetum coccineum]